MYIIEMTTRLPADPDRVWQEVNKPRLLFHVAHPLIQFSAVDPLDLPDRWEEREYLLRMRLYGFVSLGRQVVSISRPEPSGKILFLRDNGHSSLIRRWDHLITVAPDGAATLYTDRIEIDAGIRTPVVAAFARIFYAHRQRRWRQLVEADFNYASKRPGT